MLEALTSTLSKAVNPWYGILCLVAVGGYTVGQQRARDEERYQALSQQISDVRVQIEVVRVNSDSINARLSQFICRGRAPYLCR